MIEGDPERGIEATAPDLKTWADLNKYKDVFATVTTGSKGRFVSAVDNWGQWPQRFGAMDPPIDYDIQFAGSEAAMLAEVQTAYTKGEAIVFYLWTPHWMFRKLDLTVLEQPPYTDECHATIGQLERDPADIESPGPCGQQVQTLWTLWWPDLEDELPDVAQFLQNLKMSDEDIAALLFDSDAGATYDEAAQAWLDANEAKWQAWIP